MKKFTLILLTLLLFTGCSKANVETDSTPVSTPSETPEVTNPITATTEMKTQPVSGDTVATLTTSEGTIKILLYTNEVPETAKNFIELAKEGKYNNVTFHRVIDAFMIQGGDFENNNGTGGYSYKGPGTYLKDEIVKGLTHIRGAVSMANAGPNTSGSQFFIVQGQNATYLDGGYSIFGYAYEGMDIVDKIAKVEKDAMDKPLKNITIEKVEISQYK